MIHVETSHGARATAPEAMPANSHTVPPTVTEIGRRKLPYLINGRRPTYNAGDEPSRTCRGRLRRARGARRTPDLPARQPRSRAGERPGRAVLGQPRDRDLA